ncbi:MAG: polysulfide reductase NrfD [Proteobacteria bacterium]|nr:polysulfide reductase NrfD [Pseudomonadota bacterium]
MKQTRILRYLRDFLWIMAIAAVVIGTARFAFGLAAATNMTDPLPWGWWKIFNMVAGAALATSGFIVAAIIYILQLEKYRPVARLSVVVGFLGYGASLSALLFDIGLPHRGWHAFFMWNPHSFLFEVFWCVSVYWGVTALELVPIVSERFGIPRFTHLMHEVMLPFVVLGVTLSSMHHSSLGSLFLASPTRLHPLWYTLWIPPEFLISAMGGGLSTIVLILLVVTWLFGKKRNYEVMSGLAMASAVLLGIFVTVKAIDFTWFGKWNFVFGPDITWESYVFWVEISLQALIPIAIFSVPAFRRSAAGLWVGTSAAFVGLVMHRLDVGIVGYFRSAESVYIPKLSEFIFGMGIVCAAGLVFLFLIEHFYILEEPEHGKARKFSLAEAKKLFLGPRTFRVVVIALLVVPLTSIAFHSTGTGPYLPLEQPVHAGVRSADSMRTEFVIDADRNGKGVFFPHEDHQLEFMDRYDLTQEETCIKCHHLNVPGDQNTPCRVCHLDLELPTPMFDGETHHERFEESGNYEGYHHGNFDGLEEDIKPCDTCHSGADDGFFEICWSCHEEDMVGLANYKDRGFHYDAPGFKYAMHGSCLTCHRREQTDATDKMSIGNCIGCHQEEDLREGVRAEELIEDGNALYLIGDLEAAEETYRAAIKLDPTDPKPYYHLGVLLRVAGRSAEALEVLERAVIADPDHRDGRRAASLISIMTRLED